MEALLLMAEAVTIDPKLPDPKEFFRDNFDAAIAQIKKDLKNHQNKAEHLYKEQVYNTYINLQKIYSALDYALGKFQKPGSEDYQAAVAASIEAFNSFAGAKHDSKDIESLETAEAQLAGVSVKIAEHYYQEGVKVEQAEGLSAKDKIVSLYEKAQT